MTLEPILPFEPVSASSIPVKDGWIAQIKWDGVRMLTYWDGHDVRLFNRKRNERTRNYPELMDINSYCSSGSVILDGEIIALGADGKPSFHDVMRRDGLRRLDRVSTVQQQVPITYIIFDILYCDGKFVTSLPLHERIALLSQVIQPNAQIQLATSHPDGEMLFNIMKQQQMEGIICKDLNSSYVIDGKDARWQKIKNYQDVTAVVGGITMRDGIVNALMLGLYDEAGKLIYIGHAGTGRLTAKDWRELTKQIQPLVVSERPFANQPERVANAIWLKPLIPVKVKFIGWTEGKSLRQPSIQAFVDTPPEACTWLANGHSP